MICEDETLIAMHIAAIVDDCGCEVVGPFESSREAHVAFRKQSVDAAILDIELTDGASTPLARSLRDAGVRMIVLSGLHTSSPPPEFSGVEWLGKPVNEDRVRAFCAATLALSRPRARSWRAPEPALPPAL